MKDKIKQIVMPLLVVCMIASLFLVNVFITDATEPIDDCSRIVEPYDLETAKVYINDDKTSTYPTCKTAGYLFAGWYTQITCGKDSYWGKETPGETVYALFVPSHVLGVKAQISGNMIDEDKNNDSTASIRFVTTLDSEIYRKVGFEVSYTLGNDKTSITSASNKAYKKLYAVGDNSTEYTEKGQVYTPQGSFCARSTYFKACTVKGLSSRRFSMPFSVKPFWVTMDGSKVYGDTVIRSVNDYFLEEDVWVSSTDANADNTAAHGTQEKPFKSLDYALDMVRNQGVVHVKDSYVAGSDFVWEEHDKTATITGGIVDFSSAPVKTVTEADGAATKAVDKPVLDINDAVTFKDTTLNFADGQHIYANGNSVEIASDVIWGVESAKVLIYGGAYSETLYSDTNLVLSKGNYTRVCGGNNGGVLNGNTNVTLSGEINKALATNEGYKEHEMTYAAYGAGENGSTLNGDAYLTIASETVYFQNIFGGGMNGTVNGDCHVNYTGKAMSVYAGGKASKIVGNTYFTMTGGWIEQVFGGCESANVEGNTNVDIQAGEVKRRVYGGCYNNVSGTGSWSNVASVSGHANVSIGPDVTLHMDYQDPDNYNMEVDNSIYSISRTGTLFENERGAFVLYESAYNNIKSKIGYSGVWPTTGYFLKQTHHYLVTVTTDDDMPDDSYGTVSSVNDHIRIEPKRGCSAVVKLDGQEVYYTESEAAYKLPTMTNKDEPKNIEVIFRDELLEVDITECEARIGGAYYETLEDAVNAAKAITSEGTTVVTLLKDAEVESAMTISTNVTIQNDAGRSLKVYRGTGLASTDMFKVTAKGSLTIKGIGSNSSLVVDGSKQDSTGSIVNNAGNLTLENITVQNVRRTNGNGGVVYTLSAQNANSTVTITNAVFDNNYSLGYGSILYSQTKATIIGSTFTNNKADANGGVLCNHGGTLFTVKGSNFENNEGKTGGAIWSNTQFTIENSVFDTNNAKNADNSKYDGGAIRAGGKGTIIGSQFLNNKASNTGGAIINESAGTTISGCTFNGNKSGTAGGAIINKGKDTLVSGCTFEENKAATNGGAICTDAEITINTQTTFTSNQAGNIGGAIYFTKSEAVGNVEECMFSDNKSGTAGGAIHNKGKDTLISGCTFEKNQATTNGGAICTDDSLKIEGTWFSENQTNAGSNKGGGAIFNSYDKTVTIDDCTFSLNKAIKPSNDNSYGGAIYMNNGQLVMGNTKGSYFERNEATYGGAIYISDIASAILKGTEFTSNTAESEGGAIKFAGTTLTIDGCRFADNKAIQGDVYGHDIKMAAPTRIPTIQNSEFDPARMRSSDGKSYAYIDGGGNKTPYLDTEQDGGNDEDEEIVIP